MPVIDTGRANVDEMINRDKESWEKRLREAAQNTGVGYDQSDIQDVIRNVSYHQHQGMNPDKFLRDVEQKYRERAAPTFSAGGRGGDADRNADARADVGWARGAGGQWARGAPMVQTQPFSVNDPRVAPTQHNVFSDPLTAQYERIAQQQLASSRAQQAQLQQMLAPILQSQQQLLTSQRAQYDAQQKALEEAARSAEQRRGATAAEVDRLTKYLNARVGKLQGPAYTGTEAEVLRTQLLDPLERDRTAAQKRALEQISSRGYELDSGVAQELLAQVNRAFDEQRTSAQGGLAQRQIDEQRSREQEAQQLLQYLAALPDATARGDLEYVTYVQNLLNQPRQASLATGIAGGTGVAQLMDLPNQPGMQGLGIAQLLAELPAKRLNEALAALGVAPSPSGTTSGLIQLLEQQRQQRAQQQQQAADYWSQIGRSFQP